MCQEHWHETCELLLAHEEALEEKDAEIMLVKARIYPSQMNDQWGRP